MLLGGGSLSGKLKVSNLIQKSGIVVDEKRTIDILDSITGKYNKIKYTKILFFSNECYFIFKLWNRSKSVRKRA